MPVPWGGAVLRGPPQRGGRRCELTVSQVANSGEILVDSLGIWRAIRSRIIASAALVVALGVNLGITPVVVPVSACARGGVVSQCVSSGHKALRRRRYFGVNSVNSSAGVSTTDPWPPYHTWIHFGLCKVRFVLAGPCITFPEQSNRDP